MIYFYGASFSTEYSELEAIYDKFVRNKIPKGDWGYSKKTHNPSKYILPQSPPKNYPQLVSEALGIAYKNFSINGSSHTSMLDQLCKSNIKSGDHAIFSLTSPARDMYYAEDTSTVDLDAPSDPNEMNDVQYNWKSAMCCFGMYSFCVQNNITPWFINTMNVAHYKTEWSHPLWEQIPDKHWIIDKHSCVIELFDKEYFCSSNNEEYQYRNDDWTKWIDTDNKNVQKYMRPCYVHPNQLGRQLIADIIVEGLKK